MESDKEMKEMWLAPEIMRLNLQGKAYSAEFATESGAPCSGPGEHQTGNTGYHWWGQSHGCGSAVNSARTSNVGFTVSTFSRISRAQDLNWGGPS
jgi:hypothetical protein